MPSLHTLHVPASCACGGRPGGVWPHHAHRSIGWPLRNSSYRVLPRPSARRARLSSFHIALVACPPQPCQWQLSSWCGDREGHTMAVQRSFPTLGARWWTHRHTVSWWLWVALCELNDRRVSTGVLRGGGWCSSELRCRRSATTMSSSSASGHKRSLPDEPTNLDPDCCCDVCHEVLLDPVTLLCGHAIDQHCLQHLAGLPTSAQRACPVCHKTLPRRLPEVTVQLREMVQQRYPEQVRGRKPHLPFAPSQGWVRSAMGAGL